MARDQRAYPMSRRSLLGTLVGLLVAPDIAIAQGATRVRRVGFLLPGDGPLSEEEIQDILKPLRQLGWIEGRNIVFEPGLTKVREDRLDAAAKELVRREVDLILTYGTTATLAARHATTTIPIVIESAADPVGLGLVASLSHPGGNITGWSNNSPETDARRAGLVHELLPAARRVAVFVPPKGATSIGDAMRKSIAAAYRPLGVQLVFIDVLDSADEIALGEAVREAVRQQAQVLEMPAFPSLTGKHGVMVVESAFGHRLPVILLGTDRAILEAGGLFLLAPNEEDRNRRVAAMIDKILRGAKPADIPVEQPTRYDLVINLRAAKALGITVPRSLLLQADEVIR
jgi:putative ABC transport system substrate-binding protein